MYNTVADNEQLWLSFKNGNQASFQAIYHQHFSPLYEYGARFLTDKDLVKDAIHDLFVKLWSNKSNLGEVSNIRSYLLVSLRSSIFNKAHQNSKVKLTENIEQFPFEMEFSVESKYVAKEAQTKQTQLLLDALNQLSPRQKEVLYLRYFEEMDYDEIAQIMEITVKATYKLTARGIDSLRQIMNLPESNILLLLGLLSSEIIG